MISNNYFNDNKMLFGDYFKSTDYISKKPNVTIDTYTEEQTEIDTEIDQLSSRKLWQILKLSQVNGCELEPKFLQQVQQELIIRDDFDNGEAWNDPH